MTDEDGIGEILRDGGIGDRPELTVEGIDGAGLIWDASADVATSSDLELQGLAASGQVSFTIAPAADVDGTAATLNFESNRPSGIWRLPAQGKTGRIFNNKGATTITMKGCPGHVLTFTAQIPGLYRTHSIDASFTITETFRRRRGRARAPRSEVGL